MRARLKQMEMAVRARMPSPIRQAVRLVRSAAFKPPRTRELPPELLEGAELAASRLHLLDRLPKGGVVAELGTARGHFAREILARTSPKALHVVDIDYSQFDTSLLADKRLHQHIGMTYEVISSFADGSFDWIYVDADHSYEGALRDARASAAKVAPGGLMLFNDFAHIDPELGRYGVFRAVTDFVLEARWTVRYLAFQPSALYDIALQKPTG